MANIKSQIKRNRQNEKRRLRNRDYRGAARTAVKQARASFESGGETQAAVMAAISALDKAAQKGTIHPRNAARRKGRLMKRLAALSMGPRAVAEPVVSAVEMPSAEVKEAKKKPAKAEKEVKLVKEAKPKAETAKKSAAKKPAAKPAAKKTTKK